MQALPFFLLPPTRGRSRRAERRPRDLARIESLVQDVILEVTPELLRQAQRFGLVERDAVLEFREDLTVPHHLPVPLGRSVSVKPGGLVHPRAVTIKRTRDIHVRAVDHLIYLAHTIFLSFIERARPTWGKVELE